MGYPDYTLKPSDFRIDSDIDLRETFHEILYGNKDSERPRGQIIVLQSIVRDSNNQPVKSPYTYEVTGEGKDSDRGPNTTRTGYLCSESLVRVYYRPASRMIMDEGFGEAGKDVPTRDVCYFSYKADIQEQDVVVFIKLDTDGNPISPVTIDSEVIITKVYPKKSDNGRIEYYAAIVEEQK